jgi:hypothetical protein
MKKEMDTEEWTYIKFNIRYSKMAVKKNEQKRIEKRTKVK